MQNVKFYFGSSEKFHQLTEKNPLALYFLEDVQQLWKGDKLYATGQLATNMADGLMSYADKAKLDELTVGGVNGLSAIDGTISILDTEDGGKAIGVAISQLPDNALMVVEGGLFVPQMLVPRYTIEKQDVATEGFSATYKLKQIVGEDVVDVGDEINIGKDMVLQGATLETVSEANVPYEGAAVGDPYIDMAFNDESKSHIYIPVKGLVDTYSAGRGIEIVDNAISVKIATESHGLVMVDGGLSLLLASADNDGALSRVDKAFIDSIPEVYASKEFVNKTAEQVKYEISNKPEGTIVKYRENEIRVMCPADTAWVKQTVGGTGNPNMYYMGFKAYAPEGAVSFKEGDRGVIIDEMFDFNGSFAGTDEFGRNYSICWLALASYNETSGEWTYFGKNSSAEKYIGWDYCVEWYDANGVIIAADQIRINLSNEDCHDVNVPYYMSKYATVEQLDDIEQSMSWGEL